MNIGYFTLRDWYPPRTGSGVHAYQVVSHLTRRGHTVSTIFADYSDPGVTSYSPTNLVQFLNEIDLIYIRPHPRFGSQNATLMKLPALGKIPVVWELNAPVDELRFGGCSRLQVARHKLNQRFLASLVDACICNTSAVAEYACTALGSRKNHVVPLGSDPDLFSPSRADPELYAGCAGSFKVAWIGTPQNAWNGVKRILEIPAQLAAVDPDITMIMIGHEGILRRYAKDTVRCFFPGEISYFDTPPYLASADVGLCVYMNKESDTSHYRSPLKLFDYMASGLPVVASNSGQIREVVEGCQCGIVVNNTKQEIADAILHLKRNPEERVRMGRNARKGVEDFYNWERVASQTGELLESLIARKGVG